MGLKELSAIVWACLTLGVFGNSTVTYSPDSRSFFNAFPLAPLTVVKFANKKCDAGSGQLGTCLAKTECYRKGGVIKGSCAEGFGTCCIMAAKENGVAFGNNTLIHKDKFNGGVHVTYTVMKMSDDICEYRLDVKSLYMYEVEADGSCLHDWMTVNQDHKFKRVCGLTKNIHYYIDVLDDFMIFTFHTDPSISYSRHWEIYVSQFTCDMGAPEGCGQWYTGESGTIEIWNNVDPSTTHWYYIEDQIYAICVRWEAGYCSITYNEATRFQPKCDDLFERPGSSGLNAACIYTPPSTTISYTLYEGLQYFYIEFTDNTNQHIGSSSNPFKNPSISYQQTRCT